MDKRVVVAVTIASLALSFLLHLPTDAVTTLTGYTPPPPIGSVYSDIIAGVYGPIFEDPSLCPSATSDRWIDRAALQDLCRGVPRFYLPYRDYVLEYPPLVGALWALSTNLGFAAAGFRAGPEAPAEARAVAKLVHYAVQSAAIGAAALVLMRELWRVSEKAGLSRLYVILPLLPSFVVYAIYNWDLLAAALAVLSLRLLLEERYLAAGVSMGLAVSAKLMPVAAGLVIGYELLQELLKGRRGRFAPYLLGLVLGLLPYLALATGAPTGFRRFIEHHAAWYCENCVMLLLFWDPMAPGARAASILAVLVALILVTLLPPSRAWPRWPVDKAFLATSLFIALNYVFTPQMLLMIAPLALLVLKGRRFWYYVAVDVLNALIILLWFHDSELRSALAFLGIPQGYNPWGIDSPIQMIAAVRNLLLLYLLLRESLELLSPLKPYAYTPPGTDLSKAMEGGEGA